MKDSIQIMAKVFKTLGDANRLDIVLTINRDRLSVTDIINSTGLSQTLVSFHLRTLRESGIVKTERNGPFIYYSLLIPGIIDIIENLSTMLNCEDIDANIPLKRNIGDIREKQE